MNVEVHPEVAPWSVLLSAPTWETEKTSGILGTKIKDSKNQILQEQIKEIIATKRCNQH